MVNSRETKPTREVINRLFVGAVDYHTHVVTRQDRFWAQMLTALNPKWFLLDHEDLVNLLTINNPAFTLSDLRMALKEVTTITNLQQYIERGQKLANLEDSDIEAQNPSELTGILVGVMQMSLANKFRS